MLIKNTIILTSSSTFSADENILFVDAGCDVLTSGENPAVSLTVHGLRAECSRHKIHLVSSKRLELLRERLSNFEFN